MKKFDVAVEVEQLNYDELTSEEAKLVLMAQSATFNSYAPYSKFNVGAAILLSNGEIVTGSNQENVAFPSGTCAERTAAFYAHAAYPKETFKMIAIAARGTDGEALAEPIPPCGACRQSLLEFEMLAKEDVKVLLIGKDFIYRLPSVHSLLPLAFSNF